MPKVSVIVPTFNSAPFLGETLDSISCQQEVDLEIVVVDDASTDDTADVVAGHPAPRLRHLALPVNHGGPSRPRNVGVATAAGDYIAFFDSDDLMLPGHLARSLRFLIDHPEAGLVFSRGLRWSEEGHLAPHLAEHVYTRFHQLPRRSAGPGTWLLPPEAAYECLFFENFILPSGVVMPRKILDEVGPFDESLRNGDDRDLWFRVARRYPLGYLEAYGFYYRVRGGSVSGRGAQLAENRIRVLRKQLAGPLPPAARRGARRLIARNLYGIGYMHQANGDQRAARRDYLESLKERFSAAAVRGLVLGLLPPALRERVRRGRRSAGFPVLAGEPPLVSIVVTCFNYAHYLAGCLESVLGQTYRNFEVVLVNDGSTDDTDEVVLPFLADPRITYLRQENRGQAVAKNVGIARSRGEFVAFLDADDRWEPDKLERQIPLFANQETGVVYSRARYVDADGKGLELRLGKFLTPRSGRVTGHLFMDNFVPFSSSVVRRECLDRYGAFDESLPMGIDWDLWLRLSVHYRFDFVDQPLLVYRLGHPGQMSRKTEVRQACSDRIMSGFMARHPEFLTRRTVSKALAYTFRNRGYYFREIDFEKSLSLYWQAIRTSPLEFSSYKGLGKSAARHLMRKTGLWRKRSKSPT